MKVQNWQSPRQFRQAGTEHAGYASRSVELVKGENEVTRLMSGICITIAVTIVFSIGFAQTKPSTTIDKLSRMRSTDRIRIAEAFHIAEQLQNELWAGWSEIPFAMLLVTEDREFLLRHPCPTEDFVSIGFDSLLQCEVYHRESVFPKNISAAFGAVSDVPTVVFGQPENTGKSSTAWTISLLHEHFHQLQNSTLGYWEAVDALDLSGDDKTGMWMLNYPFPYDSIELGDQFSEMCAMLLQALGSIGTPSFTENVQGYIQSRTAIARTLLPEDNRYFSFQVWMEGVARYTEYQMARLAAERYEPTDDFRSLEDYTPFQKFARDFHDRTLNRLEELSLAEYGRVAFYYVGAGEALLLDEVSPDWRTRYFSEWFALEDLFRR